MNLPKKITPDPLVQASVEIRVQTTLNADSVLETLYPIFAKDFPKVKPHDIPSLIRQNEGLYAPTFLFRNEKYSIGVAHNTILFEIINGYESWDIYFPIICENLDKINKLNIIKGISRIGIRYASVFETESDLSKIVNFTFANDMSEQGFNQTLQVYNAVYTKEKTQIVLQLAANAMIANSYGVVKNGPYIDIDCSVTNINGTTFDENVFSLIKELHDDEKNIFYSLIKKDFLQTLNPQYS